MDSGCGNEKNLEGRSPFPILGAKRSKGRNPVLDAILSTVRFHCF